MNWLIEEAIRRPEKNTMVFAYVSYFDTLPRCYTTNSSFLFKNTINNLLQEEIIQR